MPVSRRSFVATLGAGATGLIGAPLLSWRGHEALFAQQQQPALAAAEPHAERLLASMPGMVRLDSNENPNGPGQRALAAITQHFGEANRYPVKQPDDLIAEIAKVQGVKPENIILGCGSGELLRTAVITFTSRDRALVAPDPTFESPGNFAKFLGNPIRAPKVDSVLKLDLNATADAAKGAGLVYYCNPNNPTATVHGASDTKSFVDQVLRSSPDTTILIDEAYHEYVADPSYATMIPLAVTNPRVIVTRSFSKAYGLAGLRVGYAVASASTARALRSTGLEDGVTAIAAIAAAAAIEDRDHLETIVGRNADDRQEFVNQANARMLRVIDSQTNFVMLNTQRPARPIVEHFLRNGIALPPPVAPLNEYVRVSLGSPSDMDEFWRVWDLTGMRM